MMGEQLPVVCRVERAVNYSLRMAGIYGCGVPVVIAVSGGADSLCLLYALHRTVAAHRCLLHVAHLDHMLRGADAQADARFVEQQSAALGIRCVCDARDVAAWRRTARCSLEEAARDLRYAFLRSVALRVGAQAVLTGHTRDDAVETILLHILRGSGNRGLSGLSLVSEYPGESTARGEVRSTRLIRPLLKVSRADAVEYCQSLGLVPREDRTNQSATYLRNRVRLELLPAMRQLNARIDDALLRLAAVAASDDEALDLISTELWWRCAAVLADRVHLDVMQFAQAPEAIQSRLVFRAVEELRGSRRDVTAKHIAAVLDVAAGEEGRQVDLPHSISWRRGPGCVTAFLRDGVQEREPMPEAPLSLSVPGVTDVPGGCLKARTASPLDYVDEGLHVAYLDADRCCGRLSVRRRRPGDRFRPLGLKGEKKLQDFMVDAHIPIEARDSVPIVCDEQHIVWVAGHRLDDRVRVTADSRALLRLEYVPAAEP